jgi:K+-sensing histidine kinase KdpD
VDLLHVLPPTPPQHLEHGGGDTREEQERKDARLAARRAEWTAEARERVTPVFRKARRVLERSGLAPESIHEIADPAVHYREVARHALETARERGCDTIVVARESHPWHVELFHRHVADVLREEAEGVDVHVV